MADIDLTQTNPLPDPPSVRIIGYNIDREISRGGQAVVYEGSRIATNERVALKVIQGGAFLSEAQKSRFSREVKILKGLTHPCIVNVLDHGFTADGSYYLAMKYIEGVALDEYLEAHLRSFGDSDEARRERIRLFVHIADAVNAVHLRGVIHRDLKPSNIRVDKDGKPHVLDFGLARLAFSTAAAPNNRGTSLALNQQFTTTGQLVGSLPWISPEQAEGLTDTLDVRTDVYSLGVMLYQAMTGEFPYDVTGSIRSALNNILTTIPVPPSKVASRFQTQFRPKRGWRRLAFWAKPHARVDAALEAIVLKALQKKRELRYQSAGDIERDLQHYLAGRSTIAEIDIQRRERLSAMQLGWMGAIMISLLAVGAIAWWQHELASGLHSEHVTSTLRSTASVAMKPPSNATANAENHAATTGVSPAPPTTMAHLPATNPMTTAAIPAPQVPSTKPQPGEATHTLDALSGGAARTPSTLAPNIPAPAAATTASPPNPALAALRDDLSKSVAVYAASFDPIYHDVETFRDAEKLATCEEHGLALRSLPGDDKRNTECVLPITAGESDFAAQIVASIDPASDEGWGAVFANSSVRIKVRVHHDHRADLHVWKYDHEGQSWKDIENEPPEVRSDNIRAPGEDNSLLVEVRGQRVSAFVNDTAICISFGLPAPLVPCKSFQLDVLSETVTSDLLFKSYRLWNLQAKSLRRVEPEQILLPTTQPATMPIANGDVAEFTNSVGMKFKLFPAGKFVMGTAGSPVNAVVGSPFYCAVSEVTQRQWTAIMDFNPSAKFDLDAPVCNVTWIAACQFCQRLANREHLSYSMPSGAQWEWAYRDGSSKTTKISGFDSVRDAWEWCSDSSSRGSAVISMKDDHLASRVLNNPDSGVALRGVREYLSPAEPQMRMRVAMNPKASAVTSAHATTDPSDALVRGAPTWQTDFARDACGIDVDRSIRSNIYCENGYCVFADAADAKTSLNNCRNFVLVATVAILNGNWGFKLHWPPTAATADAIVTIGAMGQISLERSAKVMASKRAKTFHRDAFNDVKLKLSDGKLSVWINNELIFEDIAVCASQSPASINLVAPPARFVSREAVLSTLKYWSSDPVAPRQ